MAKSVVDAFAEYPKSFLVEANSGEEAAAVVERMFDEGKIMILGWEFGDVHFELASEEDESMAELVKTYAECGEKPING